MTIISSSSSTAGHMAQPASQPERGAQVAPDTQKTMTTSGKDHLWKPVARVVSRWVGAVRLATLEPVMLLDGACNQAMLIIMENVQMQKICSLKLGLSPEVCQNLSMYEEETIQVQQAFTRFSLYNSILMSLLPAFVGIFLGAWSDKYGRKIPLLVTLLAHVANAAGYLLNHYMTTWPLEVLFIVTFLESIGGGNASFLSMGTCYTSDLSSLKSHTSRVSTNNSLWYLGGPLGTLICGLLLRNGNFAVPLMLAMMTYIGAVFYICFFIKETHGPFMHESFKRHDSPDDTNITKAEVTKKQMVRDFFQLRHVRDAYKTVLKRREGNTRLILVAVVVSNMIRRVARGFFMYMFVRRALLWEADDYSYWMTYRSLVAALGSLSLVPTLSKWMTFSDSALALLGTVSIMLEYICYGLVNADRVFFMWLGPPLGILANANVIAIRSSATKLVRKEEKGESKTVGYNILTGYFSLCQFDFP
ncbi:proton-coupled folate transporter-like [Panulirus ornatus]|uniref:proton-coupled folate transporter-like n=1 Tax=Panulirus ornatus TaxID=150431 RepID=UPI003A83ACF3